MNTQEELAQPEEFSIKQILRQLDENTEDLDKSLARFLKDRESVLKSQKHAIARYEAELLEIDSSNSAIGNFNPKTATVDHNIFKHLRIKKEVSGERDNDQTSEQILSDRIHRAPIMLIDQNSYIEKNKKFMELDQTPVPSFDQKKQIREDMFFYMEDATIEETRLELEIEQARETCNWKLLDELSDALFVLQRLNTEKLVNLITEYQPQPISKTWGSDPEYAKLSRQLVQLAEHYAIYDSNELQKRR